MSHTLKIGRYDIVDAETPSQNEIAIPCHTNPGLTHQLDAWDHATSVPAVIDHKPVNLELGHYDKQHHRWILKIPA